MATQVHACTVSAPACAAHAQCGGQAAASCSQVALVWQLHLEHLVDDALLHVNHDASSLQHEGSCGGQLGGRRRISCMRPVTPRTRRMARVCAPVPLQYLEASCKHSCASLHTFRLRMLCVPSPTGRLLRVGRIQHRVCVRREFTCCSRAPGPAVPAGHTAVPAQHTTAAQAHRAASLLVRFRLRKCHWWTASRLLTALTVGAQSGCRRCGRSWGGGAPGG